MFREARSVSQSSLISEKTAEASRKREASGEGCCDAEASVDSPVELPETVGGSPILVPVFPGLRDPQVKLANAGVYDLWLEVPSAGRCYAERCCSGMNPARPGHWLPGLTPPEPAR